MKYRSFGWDWRVVGSFDPCSKGPGFQTTHRPITKCVERICQPSVITGKKREGIKMSVHIERKDQGGTAR